MTAKKSMASPFANSPVTRTLEYFPARTRGASLQKNEKKTKLFSHQQFPPQLSHGVTSFSIRFPTFGVVGEQKKKPKHSLQA